MSIRPVKNLVTFVFDLALILSFSGASAVFGMGQEIQNVEANPIPQLPEYSAPRPPANPSEALFWTAVMNAHNLDLTERARVFGWEREEIEDVQKKLADAEINSGEPWLKTIGLWSEDRIRIAPYPGGRHPRMGFLDGALKPQRETKISVFTPWDPESYVVVDVPEAIWSNLGLTFLAHTHIPTVWDQQGSKLEKQEWELCVGGLLKIERRLPNGVIFTVRITPVKSAVLMEIELFNGSQAPLSRLATQNCLMLKGVAGMEQQTLDNKVFIGPYAACQKSGADQWVITAWEPLNRAWGEPRCPCLHSDPVFPDCPVGEKRVIRGWLSFYEGDDIKKEIQRLDKTGWRQFAE